MSVFILVYHVVFRVDGIIALQILADAAKSDVTILRTLQNLAKGSQPKPPIHLQSESGMNSYC